MSDTYEISQPTIQTATTPTEIDTTLDLPDLPDELRKNLSPIGYSSLLLWWKDDGELHEDSTIEEIMISFFHLKFGRASDFLDIVNNEHFSPHAKSSLLDIYNDFLEIFDEYTPWEWLSWYIHMIYTMCTKTPAPCSFQLGNVHLPEHIKHFHYGGTISKHVKSEEINQFVRFINLIMAQNQNHDVLKPWFYGTFSVYANSIIRSINLSLKRHFGHAFGFHKSFYICDNLKYCIVRALQEAGGSNVNCALLIFHINEEMLSRLEDNLKLVYRESVQGDLIDKTWEDIVPISRDSIFGCNKLENDPISPNVQWVEGANLKRSNNTWIPKVDDTIRSFRTTESTQFLHSQLTSVITFKNPRILS